LKILFVDQFSDPGGAQLCLIDLLPEVLRRGWSARLMVPGDGELVRCGIPADSLPLNRYHNGRKSLSDLLRFGIDIPRAAVAIGRAVRRHGIDLVYVNGPRVLPAVWGLRCPVIFHAHSLVKGSGSKALVARTLRSTQSTVIAASQFVARDYPGAHVIYNGVPDLWRGARSFGGDAPRIGILGRIAPEKGQEDFVRAARLIAEVIPGARFIVHGERMFSESAYDLAVRKLAEGTAVEFPGWTRDVAGALQGLDVLAVPSGAGEAATRVIMEAFSAGTPVVAYPSGGIPELVQDGRTGVLTGSADFRSLTKSIQDLLKEPGRMRRLSVAGRAEWDLRFRLETFRDRVCDATECGQAQAATTIACEHDLA
jgi:glycosyltransferase involved in cell wall biosynthesis